MASQNLRPGNRLMDRPEYSSKKPPLTCAPDMTVLEAVNAMSRESFGSIIVVTPEKKVIGLATERDVMTKLVAHQKDPSDTPISEIMTKDPRTARETDDLLDWLRIMSNERFRRLPVVDDDGRIKAVFTQGDFVSYTWPDLIYQMKSLATASITKNFALVLIASGIAIYSIVMVIVINYFT